ncbi:MAG: hypothetical protein WC816_00605 [Sphingomonas sp.]
MPLLLLLNDQSDDLSDEMVPTLVVSAIVAVPVAAAVVGTAGMAFIVKWLSAKTVRNRLWALIGSVIPALIASYGLYLVSPWPWRQPEPVLDGFPPGPLLVIAVLPSWALCLLTSRLILRRRPV